MTEGNSAARRKANRAASRVPAAPDRTVATGASRAHHRGMRSVTAGLWLGFVGLIGAASAQDPAAGATPPQQPAPKRSLGAPVDGVVAPVNDSGLLTSQIRTLAASRLRALRAQGGMRPEDELAVLERTLDGEIDRYRLALAAKTMSPLPPEQLEDILRREFERDRQEQVRDLGSLTRFSDELKRVGRTWPMHQREQRIQKLYELADEFAVGRRLMGQTRHFLTPGMLQKEYEANRDLFVRPGMATVVQVRFSGPDAEKNATAAAAAWRNEEITARALAERFPDAIGVGAEIAVDKLATELAPVKEFALAGPAGAVSSPVLHRGAFVIAKVAQFAPARNDAFIDPTVQEQLRDLCTQKIIVEFREQAAERAKQRTEVWRAQ
jgi:hypothetical protein